MCGSHWAHAVLQSYILFFRTCGSHGGHVAPACDSRGAHVASITCRLQRRGQLRFPPRPQPQLPLLWRQLHRPWQLPRLWQLPARRQLKLRLAMLSTRRPRGLGWTKPSKTTGMLGVLGWTSRSNTLGVIVVYWNETSARNKSECWLCNGMVQALESNRCVCCVIQIGTKLLM